MTRPIRPALPALALAAAWAAAAPAGAADLPFAPPLPPTSGASAGGGFRVARAPVRPAPLRYDVYGYPLIAGLPSPLAAGGCPPALQPDYDADGNFDGYAPFPMCR